MRDEERSIREKITSGLNLTGGGEGNSQRQFVRLVKKNFGEKLLWRGEKLGKKFWTEGGRPNRTSKTAVFSRPAL